MTIVIMAAGMGSRYGGLKQIDPVGEHGEFILDFSIYDAIKAGFDKVVFIIKEENLELFKETVGDRIAKKIAVSYAFQKMDDIPAVAPKERTKPWGTAQAVLAAAPLVKENFAVINADDFYGREAFFLLADYLKKADAAAKKADFCMVGYVLEKTLTDNGHVARGVCTTTADGMLDTITERTHIEKKEGKAQFYEEQTGYTVIDAHSTVSMNCWGFTPAIFDGIRDGYKDFFENNKDNLLKAEYFLPFVVDDMLKADKCGVRVLQTKEQWYGVTYHEDKAKIVDFIKGLTANAVYPHDLWSNV